MAAGDRSDPGGGREAAPRRDDEPVLPEVAQDDRDLGWGEDPHPARRDAEWYRRERPPHHE
jgi:hypothetical protein